MFKTALAMECWKDNYQYNNETPIETQIRIARTLASVEKDKKIWEDKFLKTLVKYDKEGNPIGLKCTPGGRITANLGTSFSKATLLNCFIGAPVSNATITYQRKSEKGGLKYDVTMKTDDTPDDLMNIFLSVMEQAKTLASEGGYGVNFDFIRPRGSIIKGTGIKHPGVVAYMKIWDSVATCIVKGSDDGYVNKIKNYLGEEKFEELKKIVTKKKIRKGAMLSALSCVSGDTLISTLDGKIPIQDLVDKNPYIFCRNKEGSVFLRRADKVWKTGVRKTVKIMFDNDNYLICTPDHKIMLRDGEYIEAKNLKPGDSVSVFYKTSQFRKGKYSTAGYFYVGVTGKKNTTPIHHIVSEMKYGRIPKVKYVYKKNWKTYADDSEVIHHIDGNSLNNHPDNLDLIYHKEHSEKHKDTMIELFGRCRKDIADRRRGKTWEEQYGVEKATVLKKLARERIKLKREGSWNKGIASIAYKAHYKKGFSNQFNDSVKTWDEAYGFDEAVLSKKKKTETLLNNIYKRKNKILSNHKIISVTEFKELDVYDISVPEFHNFVANDIFVHNCSHPDCEEYVRAKQKEKDEETGTVKESVLTKFNMSVLVTSEFMKAVENDDLFDQTFNGKVYKRIKARDLYNVIMESAYNRGEPGILFFDNMQSNNPLSYLGDLTCTNPCLHGDSLFLTKKGLEKVSDLCGTETEIWNGSKWSTSKIVYTGIKSVYEVRMSNGMFIRGTEDHVLGAINGEEVKLGSSAGKSLERISGSDWTGIQADLSFEELQCLGFSFGDANFHEASNRYKYVYIGENDNDIELLFNSVGEELPEEGRYDKRIISINFADKCKLMDFPEVIIPERKLSKRILTLPPSQLCQFLKGLFSANGSVQPRYHRVSLKSTCRGLIDQVQIVLMSLGIKSYVTTNKAHNVKFDNGTYECKESYDLNITSDDLATFKEKIGFIQGYKQGKLIDAIPSVIGRRLPPKVVSIEYLGEEKVYDFTEPETHWAFVNGLKTHNCGEIGGFSKSLTTVCLLGSLNLPQYIEIDDKHVPYFDYDSYRDDIAIFTRMLDNVNELSYNPLPSYDWAMKNLRQIGMGVNGLGSALVMLGIPYNSDEAVEFAKRVCVLKENVTWQTSAELAAEKGTFPAYNKEAFEGTAFFNSDRITEETRKMLKKFGARNGKTTTNPPLGNSSIMSDYISNGIEPLYTLDIERKVICTKWPEGLTQDNVKNELKFCKGKDYEYWEGSYEGKKYYYEPNNRGLCEIVIVRDYGYQWLLDNYPDKDHSKYLMTSQTINIEDHLKMQEVIQHYVNQSVSKTVNVPKNYPFEDFKQLYLSAWKRGLNGLAAYREGSMESVLSSLPTKKSGVVARDIKLPPSFTNGPTSVMKKEGKKFYMHFSYLPDDKNMSFPVCLWIYTNAHYKDDMRICNHAVRNLAKLALSLGIDKNIVQEALNKSKEDYPHNRLGRMVSLNLRHNVPREEILEALVGIEGDNISTLLTAVRKFLSSTLTDGTRLKKVACPICGHTEVIIQSGCILCTSCWKSVCN